MALARSAAAPTLAIVAASSAAAPTTFGRLAVGALGGGGSLSSMRAQRPLKIDLPMRAAMKAAMSANGL